MTEDMRERFERFRKWFATTKWFDDPVYCEIADASWQAALSSAGTPTDIGALAKSIVHYVLRTFARSDADRLTVDVAGQLSAFMESRLGGLQALVQQNKEIADSLQKEVSAGMSGTADIKALVADLRDHYNTDWDNAYERDVSAKGWKSEREARERAEKALRRLLATDGHKTTCAFTGCNCGKVEDYKIARADACASLKSSEGAK